MVRFEIYKICRRKLVIFMMVVVFVSVFIYTYLYSYTSAANYSYLVCLKEGETITGMEAMDYNKKIAMSYKGKITDELVEQICNDSENIPHSEWGRYHVTNTTLAYFEVMFKTDTGELMSVKEAYPNYEGDLIYGYSDNWRGLYTSICDFLLIFVIFIIIMAAPLFSSERECGMAEVLMIAKNGGNEMAGYKIKAAFILMNLTYILNMALLLIINFILFGIEGYETSIQCHPISYFYTSFMDCSYGQLVLHTVILGWLGSNLILLLVIIVSIKAKKSF